MVVSPDAGRVKLNKKFAEKVGAELAILNKERPAHQVAEIGYVIGDVKGKTAVIVDDMIDTAGTLKAAGADRARRGRHARLRRRHAPGPLRQRVREPRRRAASSRSSSPTRSRCAPGAPDNIRVLSVRRPADRLDPPDLHRRLGVRGLRRREPALLSCSAQPPAGAARPLRRGAAGRPRRGPADRAHRRARPQARAADPARPARRGRGARRRAGAAALGARAGPARAPARPPAGARLRRASRTRSRRSPSAASCCARAASAPTRRGPGASRPARCREVVEADRAVAVDDDAGHA